MGKNMTTYLKSKPRYEILDGLRGVAALIVVAFHLFETYSQGVPYQVLNHGYLAVDFFFVLSGFVIGYAYDDRWNRISMLDFCKRRLIRLHPMLIIGTLFGACLFFLGEDYPGFSMMHNIAWWQVALCTLACLFLFPMSKGMDIRGCIIRKTKRFASQNEAYNFNTKRSVPPIHFLFT
jgi:peptidoglycan/LPS O-acetylase OafA/YrhL